MTTPANTEEKSRKLSLLGIILQALHPLFAITAIIGLFVSIMSLKSTEGTIYYSHLKWQVVTFWIGLVAYALALFVWSRFGLAWPIIVTFLFVAYRVVTNFKHWARTEPLERKF